MSHSSHDVVNTPLTPDYVGNLRHQCPQCDRSAALRVLVRGGAHDRDGHRTYYCEYIGCDWASDADRVGV